MHFVNLHNLAEYERLIYMFILKEFTKIELDRKLHVAI